MTTEELAGLEEQRDVLLASLRDLEQERAAGEIGDDDYAALKDDYTVRAAAVLRTIEAGPRAGTPQGGRQRPGTRRAGARTSGGRPAAARRSRPSTRTGDVGRGHDPADRHRLPGKPGSGRPRSRPAGVRPADGSAAGRRRRSLTVTLGVAFVVAALAGGSVALLAGARDPGQPVTGSVPGGTSDRMSEALSLETDGRAVDALKVYDEIIQGEPGNVEALAYRGWLLKRAGLPDKALESLDRAVAADPTFADAHFFRGMVLYEDKDDPAGAVAEFQAFLANGPPPEFVTSVQDLLSKAEAAAAAKAAAGTPTPTPAAP